MHELKLNIAGASQLVTAKGVSIGSTSRLSNFICKRMERGRWEREFVYLSTILKECCQVYKLI